MRKTKVPSEGWESYRVYIADFGIARSYTSAAEAETDSWTSFTRSYAAPEVVMQEKRGLSADIFSLGCVYIEMLAVLGSREGEDLRRSDIAGIRAINPDGDQSYQANLEGLHAWLVDPAWEMAELIAADGTIRYVTAEMLNKDPQKRPTAQELEVWLGGMAGMFQYINKVILTKDPERLRPTIRGLGVWLQSASFGACRCDAGPEPFEAADDGQALPT
jgi:serine/threonine protein kinase